MKTGNWISKCCGAVVIVVNGVEGTSYYKCDNCGKPCDAIQETKPMHNKSRKDKKYEK